MFIYICDELFQHHKVTGGIVRLKDPNEVMTSNYRRLHDEGKLLMTKWFQRAWRIWDNDRNENKEVFEPFIFTWFAFNSWAACVTDKDKDADIMDALAADREINETFNNLLSQLDSQTAINARKFSDLLPIFDAKELNRMHILRFDNGDSRVERVNYYFNEGATKFEPKCWKRHSDSGESIPLDWAHILKAIYKVRCNLFHGQKMAHSEMNRQIVSAAFLTLANFLHEGGYLRKQVR